jgi:thiol-disulfide isomerase/thioredoxin
MSFLLALFMTLTSVGTATSTDDFETSDQAMEALEALMIPPREATRLTAEQLRERTVLLRSWLDRAEALDLDFGPRNYVVNFAIYGSAGSGRDEASVDKRREASMALLEHARRNGGIPAGGEVWDDWVARLATVGFSNATKESDWKDAAQAVILMVPRSRDPRRSLEQAMRSLEASGGMSSPLARAGLAVAISETTRFDLAQKDRLLSDLYSAPADQAAEPTGEGKPARPTRPAAEFVPFTGPLLGGGEISVDDFKGKVLLIDYWATWCGPCLREMPNVVEAWKKYKDDGFAILGVSLDRADAEEKIRSTMTKYGMDWPQIYDGGGWSAGPARLNGVRSIPATYLLDREGNLVATRLQGEALGAKIAEVLGKEPATTE